MDKNITDKHIQSTVYKIEEEEKKIQSFKKPFNMPVD